jgi:DNA polymerase-3 subunit alpha
MDVYSNNGVIEVVLWANTLQKFHDLVVKGQQVAVLGKKDGDDKMIADKLKPYDQWLTDVTRKLNRNKF